MSRAQRILEDAVADYVSRISYAIDFYDYHDDESFGRVTATGPDGKVVGTIDLGVTKESECGPWYTDSDGSQVADIIKEWEEVNIKLIDVKPEYQRHGIATQMVRKLKAECPGAKIDYGMAVSSAGSAFVRAMGEGRAKRILEQVEMVGSLRVCVSPSNLRRICSDLNIVFDEDAGMSKSDLNLRILIDPAESKWYVWQAYYKTHEEMARDLGIDIDLCVRTETEDLDSSEWAENFSSSAWVLQEPKMRMEVKDNFPDVDRLVDEVMGIFK